MDLVLALRGAGSELAALGRGEVNELFVQSDGHAEGLGFVEKHCGVIGAGDTQHGVVEVIGEL